MSIKERLKQYLRTQVAHTLYENDTELWYHIVEATNFLIDPAIEQRCWHIINNSYKVQLCPIDNIPVKWNSRYYLKYSSHSARRRDPKFTEQRMKAYRERTGKAHWNRREPMPNEEDREIYNRAVDRYTDRSRRWHMDKINPTGQKISRKWVVDHIFSRYEGFKQGIDPQIIGHWTNLKAMTQLENGRKNSKCGKTKEQLFEDYDINR